MPDTIDRRTDLVQRPPRTPPGFSVTQFVGEEGTEFDAPLAEGLVTDLDAALREQLLNISVAERKAVVQPDGVLDDGHWESVAIRFQLGHGGSAYPRPIKATQPLRLRVRPQVSRVDEGWQ